MCAVSFTSVSFGGVEEKFKDGPDGVLKSVQVRTDFYCVKNRHFEPMSNPMDNYNRSANFQLELRILPLVQ